jgi:hypothetical protein
MIHDLVKENCLPYYSTVRSIGEHHWLRDMEIC